MSTKDLTASEKNSLAELSCHNSLRSRFIQYNQSEFWLHVKKSTPHLATKALKKHLMPFPVTYLCEQAFSLLFYIKAKYRDHMNVEPELCLKQAKLSFLTLLCYYIISYIRSLSVVKMEERLIYSQ
jgi:hypothetical protein